MTTNPNTKKNTKRGPVLSRPTSRNIFMARDTTGDVGFNVVSLNEIWTTLIVDADGLPIADKSRGLFLRDELVDALRAAYVANPTADHWAVPSLD